SGLPEPAADQRRAWKAAAASAWRTSRTRLRPYVRNRRHAKNAPAASRQHHQAPAHPCGRLQSEPDSEETSRTWDPPGIPGQPECPAPCYADADEITDGSYETAKAANNDTASNPEGRSNAPSISHSLPEFRRFIYLKSV